MKQYTADRIRNVAIAGHGGSGKTSLAEAMLYRAGATDRLGRTADGNTVCDCDQEEIKRKVSVSSAVAPLEWKDNKVNLIDCPGLFDFAVGMSEGIRAAESVLIVVSAKSGVNVGTEKAYKLATQLGKAKLFYINKMDTEHADFHKVMEGLHAAFGTSACPMVVPYVEDHKVVCYIDLLDDRAFSYAADGSKTNVEIPAGAAGMVNALKDDIKEAVAETSDELMDKFFSGEEFTQEEIRKGLLQGGRSGAIAPVFCGSAITTEAINPLLNAIVTILPSAADNAGEQVKTPGGEELYLDCRAEDPLAAFVFKTVADPFVGKMSYVKVVAGKLTTASTPTNVRAGVPERMGKIVTIRGKKQEDTDGIAAGDIGVVCKLAEAVTGDSLCDPKRLVLFEKAPFPKPSLTMAIELKGKGDEGKIAQALLRLMEEDPAVGFENNTETRQQLLSGLGEQHLDVIVSKLKNKFGIEITLGKQRVAYRETIRKKVKVQGRHKKQSGGHGQFGDVWIEFEPCDSEGLVFEENVFGGSVPKNFFPAVEKGLQECVRQGTIAGYPVVGLKATLVDGSYHPVDSSEMAFKTAASLAYKAGLPMAGPVLLEPIGSLAVIIPDANTGDIIGELNKRRGRVLGMNPLSGGYQEIQAEVPMSEMLDFSIILRSISQGRGDFTLTFERYEQLPQQLEAAVIEEAKAMRAEGE